jgi:NADP-dependent 3-hydroxy acid dehydrogenase YdfG
MLFKEKIYSSNNIFVTNISSGLLIQLEIMRFTEHEIQQNQVKFGSTFIARSDTAGMIIIIIPYNEAIPCWQLF